MTTTRRLSENEAVSETDRPRAARVSASGDLARGRESDASLLFFAEGERYAAEELAAYERQAKLDEVQRRRWRRIRRWIIAFASLSAVASGAVGAHLYVQSRRDAEQVAAAKVPPAQPARAAATQAPAAAPAPVSAPPAAAAAGGPAAAPAQAPAVAPAPIPVAAPAVVPAAPPARATAAQVPVAAPAPVSAPPPPAPVPPTTAPSPPAGSKAQSAPRPKATTKRATAAPRAEP